MSDNKPEPAWTDECEAVLVAIKSQLDELPAYEHRMNVLVNALRSTMTREAARGVREVTGQRDIELHHLVMGLELLVNEFVDQFKTMPEKLRHVYNAELGCGHCSVCKEAKRAAYSDDTIIIRPKAEETKAAVESLIAIITGGNQRN